MIDNFNERFFDARKHRPQKGQVLAKFQAYAEFVEGEQKRDVIRLLFMDKAKEAAQVMSRIHGAKTPWCYSVPREMAEDLLVMSEEEVENKPYEMVVEFLYWTNKEYVPDDPHWETLDNTLDFDEESGTYKSTINL